jgi:hypothetical protein
MPVDEIASALGSGAKPQLPRDYLQLYLAYAAAVSDATTKAVMSFWGKSCRMG